MFKLLSAFLIGVLSVVSIAQDQPKQRRTPTTSASAQAQVRSQPAGLTGNRQFTLESIKDVLWWLPEDTETVSVARGPFKVTPPIEEPPANITAIEYADLALRTFQLGILQKIEKGSFYTSLEGRSVLFCIEGSRKFRPPAQLGEMLYEGCDIIVLQQGMGAAREVLIGKLKSRATQVQSIAGQQVAMFQERLENDFWKFFVAVPAPNVLLCATNREYLTQVLNRMHKKGQKRALPEDLPEWKHVNTAARFWAVRHYDKDDAQYDPSSPLSGEERAGNWPDKLALGIVFDLDPGGSSLATVKYLSANKDARKLFAEQGGKLDEALKPVISENEPGIVKMLVSLDDQDKTGTFLFVLAAFLGHGVFL